MGAVLATNGIASHTTAAWIHQLLPKLFRPLHVIGKGHSRRGIHVHRSPTFDFLTDAVDVDGLPTTTVARTLADLPHHLLMRAVREANYLRKLPREAPNQRVAKAMARVADAQPHLTRSELEHLFLAICDTHDLPHPEVNPRLHGKRVDFLFNASRLIIETDGRQAHAAPGARQRDVRRDRELKVRGYDTIRFTYADVVYRPEEVAHTLKALLLP